LNYPYILESILFAFLGLLIGLSIVSPAQCYYIFTFAPQTPREVFHGFTPQVILIFIIAYTAVAWFGYQLSKPFYRNIAGASRPLRYMASFFIGYLCLLGPLRLFLLFFPYPWICSFGAVFLFAAIILLTFCCPQQPRISVPDGQTPAAWWQTTLLVLISMVVLVSALLLFISQGDFSFSGHGYTQYAYLLDEWRLHNPAHFPIILQHYDELLFNCCLTWALPVEFSIILAWWLTLGFFKMSIFAFLFLLFRKMNFSFIMSLIFVFFIFAGTTSLLPVKYYLLFDSSNMLYFTAHCGRIVGVVFIFMMIADAFFSSGQNRLPVVFFILSGLGLAATPLSNPLWFIIIYAALIIYSSRVYSSGKKFFDSNGTVLCYAGVISTMILYTLDFENPTAYKYRTGAVVLMIVMALLRLLPRVDKLGIRTENTQKGRLIKQGALLLGGILIGLIFLGNMLASNAIAKALINKLEPIIGAVEFKNLPSVKGGEIFSQGGTFAIGDHRDLTGGFNEYCHGLIQFADYYGLILMMILMTNYFFIKTRVVQREYLQAEFVLYEIFLIAVASLPFFLFFTDFVQYASQAWLKTRFLETPVYIIFFVFLYFANRYCTAKKKIFLGLGLVIYTVIPFVATARPQQILYNCGAFFRPVLGHG